MSERSRYGDLPAGPAADATILPLNLSRDPRWPQRFNRLFQFAPGETPRGIDSILMAAVALNQLGPEDVWPEELRGTGFAAATAIAGQITEAQILNPAGSGKLIILEQVTLSQQTLGAQINFSYNTATLTTARNAFPVDMRQTAGKIPGAGQFGGLKAVLSSDTPAAVPATSSSAIWGTFLGVGVALIVPTWYVLPEGVGLLVSSAIQGAQSTTAGFIWREVAIPLTSPR